jgi:hypothetical protein
MQSIDVRDLPEPVAKAIAAMVQSIRQQVARGAAPPPTARPIKLPVWRGQVIGELRRREIYDDAR